MSLAQSADIGITTVAPKLSNAQMIEVVLFAVSARGYWARIELQSHSLATLFNFFLNIRECPGTVRELPESDIRARSDLAFLLLNCGPMITLWCRKVKGCDTVCVGLLS